MTQNLTSDDIFRVLNILASFISITMIMMVLINTNPLFYKDFFDNNLIFGKILGIMIVLKAIHFYQLILKINLLRVLLVGTIKSFAFITDLLKVLLLVFFVYSLIGMKFYGGGMHSNSS